MTETNPQQLNPASLVTLNGSTELAEFLRDNLATVAAHRIGDDLLVIRREAASGVTAIEVIDAVDIRDRRRVLAEQREIEMRKTRINNESTADNPLRMRGRVQLAQPDAFVQYLNDFKTSKTEIFADLNDSGGSVDAIIDYHDSTTGVAGWGKHRAALQIKTSVEYNEWHGVRLGLGQQAFCDFLEDHAHQIEDPDSARLLEICSSLAGKTESKVLGITKHAGKTKIAFSEETTVGTAEGNATLPDKMKITIPIFDGEDNTEIECRLRAGVREGRLFLTVTMPGVREKIKAAIDAIVNRISSETEIKVLRGVAPQIGIV